MTTFIKYTFTSLEPIRISDDSSSQRGQTETKRYIPGSAVRGIAVNSMLSDYDFEMEKELLLSDQVRFMNAYPVADVKEEAQSMIPSPKGFYEDKTDPVQDHAEGSKKIANAAVDGEVPPGYKRAALGMFSEIKDDTVRFYKPEVISDMKINIGKRKGEKKNVFRNECLRKGQTFTGYIAVDDCDGSQRITERLKDIFNAPVTVGNARSAGLGKCSSVTDDQWIGLPYADIMPTEDLTGECYLYLLSDTVMRNAFGEYCGLDLESLEKKLGIEDLRILFCCTSVTNIRGYNRKTGGPLPSVTMYEKGSVFHLAFKGTLTTEKMRDMAVSGIGVRRNEGFGQVRFLKDYEKVHYKTRLQVSAVKQSDLSGHEEDEDVLKNIAATYYRQRIRDAMPYFALNCRNDLKNISNSQLGNILSLIVKNRFTPQDGKKAIGLYIEHTQDKEKELRTSKITTEIKAVAQLADKIFRAESIADLLFTDRYTAALKGIAVPDKTIMGISADALLVKDSQEDLRLRLELLEEVIRYYYKGGN